MKKNIQHLLDFSSIRFTRFFFSDSSLILSFISLNILFQIMSAFTVGTVTIFLCFPLWIVFNWQHLTAMQGFSLLKTPTHFRTDSFQSNSYSRGITNISFGDTTVTHPLDVIFKHYSHPPMPQGHTHNTYHSSSYLQSTFIAVLGRCSYRSGVLQ